MYKTTDFRGTLRDAIRVRGHRGEELFQLMKEELVKKLDELGTPSTVREDQVKSGGMFGSKNPILVVTHPNPPTRFFDIGFVVNEDVISFQLLGESAQNTKANKLEDLRQQGKLVRSWLVKPDEFILQQERAWEAEVMDAFDSVFTR